MKKTKKFIALFLAIAIVATAAIAGTIAYLTTATEEVVNTFTVGNVDVTLTETSSDDNDGEYKMVPGLVVDKNPQITVTEGSENCYLFANVIAKDNTAASGADFIIYDVADGWTQYGDTTIWYMEITEDSQKGVPFSVLAFDGENDKVQVNPDLLKSDMDALLVDGAVLPTLTIRTCAVQMDNLSLAEAYAQLPTDFLA